MSNRHLNARRRRIRKEQLARRHGRRCAYCFRPFGSLREATLDHTVPLSLFRTWAAAHLVLACGPCNQAKADRLPLSIALLLCAYAEGSRPTVNTVDMVDGSGVHPAEQVFTRPFTTAGWLALARLAHANESAHRSTRDLRESTPHGQVDPPGRQVDPPGGQGDPPDCPPVRIDGGRDVSAREQTMSMSAPAVSARPDRWPVPVFVNTCPSGGEVAA